MCGRFWKLIEGVIYVTSASASVSGPTRDQPAIRKSPLSAMTTPTTSGPLSRHYCMPPSSTDCQRRFIDCSHLSSSTLISSKSQLNSFLNTDTPFSVAPNWCWRVSLAFLIGWHIIHRRGVLLPIGWVVGKEVITYVGCPVAHVDNHGCHDSVVRENSRWRVVLKSQTRAGASTNGYVQC